MAVATAYSLTPHSETASVGESAQRYLEDASTRVANVSKEVGIMIETSATVSAMRADGGLAVFSPASSAAGGFVGWLNLPETHACAARLPAGYYIIEAQISTTDALLNLRKIEDSVGLDGLRVAVERINDEAPAKPMARIELGPNRFLLGRWFDCSDGLGHCGYALTLDATTFGCNEG